MSVTLSKLYIYYTWNERLTTRFLSDKGKRKCIIVLYAYRNEYSMSLYCYIYMFFYVVTMFFFLSFIHETCDKLYVVVILCNTRLIQIYRVWLYANTMSLHYFRFCSFKFHLAFDWHLHHFSMTRECFCTARFWDMYNINRHLPLCSGEENFIDP